MRDVPCVLCYVPCSWVCPTVLLPVLLCNALCNMLTNTRIKHRSGVYGAVKSAMVDVSPPFWLQFEGALKTYILRHGRYFCGMPPSSAQLYHTYPVHATACRMDRSAVQRDLQEAQFQGLGWFEAENQKNITKAWVKIRGENPENSPKSTDQSPLPAE